MSIMELGALGEFVGAVGVVITLIYLALQIRQNTQSMQSAAEFDVLSAWNSLHNLRASSDELSEILMKGWGGRDLSIIEQSRFRSLCYSQFNIYQAIFYQHQRGALREELWIAFDASLRSILEIGALRSWLAENRLGFGRSYLNYLDTLIADLAT